MFRVAPLPLTGTPEGYVPLNELADASWSQNSTGV